MDEAREGNRQLQEEKPYWLTKLALVPDRLKEETIGHAFCVGNGQKDLPQGTLAYKFRGQSGIDTNGPDGLTKNRNFKIIDFDEAENPSGKVKIKFKDDSGKNRITEVSAEHFMFIKRTDFAAEEIRAFWRGEE